MRLCESLRAFSLLKNTHDRHFWEHADFWILLWLYGTIHPWIISQVMNCHLLLSHISVLFAVRCLSRQRVWPRVCRWTPHWLGGKHSCCQASEARSQRIDRNCRWSKRKRCHPDWSHTYCTWDKEKPSEMKILTIKPNSMRLTNWPNTNRRDLIAIDQNRSKTWSDGNSWITINNWKI